MSLFLNNVSFWGSWKLRFQHKTFGEIQFNPQQWCWILVVTRAQHAWNWTASGAFLGLESFQPLQPHPSWRPHSFRQNAFSSPAGKCSPFSLQALFLQCRPEAPWILPMWQKQSGLQLCDLWWDRTFPMNPYGVILIFLSDFSLVTADPFAYCFSCALWHPIRRTPLLVFTRNLHWTLWVSGEGSHCWTLLTIFIAPSTTTPSSS